VALLVLALALLVVAILRRARTGGRGIVAAVGVFVTVGAAYVTGRLLPWDQLALSSANRPNDVPTGVAGTFDSGIKFLFVRSREVSPSTYHWWAIAHLALGALVVVALVLVWLRATRPATAPSGPET
jgi:hypothetical protein